MLLAAAMAVVAADHALAGIPWHDNLASAKNASVVSHRPLLVIFTASWSEASDQFVQTTLATPEAVGVVSACFEAVRLDVDMNPELARRLQVTHMPTACVIDANEQLLFRFECSESKADFVAYAARAIQYASAARQAGRPAAPASAALPQTVVGPVGMPATPFASPAPLGAAPATAYPTGPAAATLPPVAGSLPPAAAPYPTTTFAAPTAPAAPEKPESKKPIVAFFESATSMFKKPAAPKPVVDTADVPPPQVLNPIQPNQVPGAGVATYGAAAVAPSAGTAVGMEGYCPVTLLEKGTWLQGNAQWGARHRGRTYLFAGPMEQQAFLAAPDRYAPVLAGDDPVLALDSGRQVAGDRRYGLTYESRVYLFSSPETLSAFTAAPDKYTRRVAMAENASRVAPDTILR